MNWVDYLGTALMLIVGLTSAVFPMKMIWFALNGTKWSWFGLIRDKDYYPSMREAKRLFDTDRKKFEEEYGGYIIGLRGFGFLLLCWNVFFLLTVHR